MPHAPVDGSNLLELASRVFSGAWSFSGIFESLIHIPHHLGVIEK